MLHIETPGTQSDQSGQRIQIDAIFDRKEALERLDGDEEFLRELGELFRRDCPQWLADMKTAMDHEGCTVVMRLAHKLKGAACVFYTRPTVAAAQRLEAAATAGSLPHMQNAFEELVFATDLFLEQLDLFLGS